MYNKLKVPLLLLTLFKQVHNYYYNVFCFPSYFDGINFKYKYYYLFISILHTYHDSRLIYSVQDMT